MAERPAILRGFRAADALAPAPRAAPRSDSRVAPGAGGPRRRGVGGRCASRPPAVRPADGAVRVPAPRRAPATCAAAGADVRPARRAIPRSPRALVGWRDADADRRSPTRTRSRPVASYASPGARRVRVQRPVGRVAGGHGAARRRSRATPRRRAARRGRPRAPASSSAAPSLAGQIARLPPRGPHRRPDPAARPRHRRASGMLRSRAPRASCSTRRSTAASLLYVRSTVHAPGAAARPARPAARRPADRRLYGTTPTARRDAGHEPAAAATARAIRAAGRPPRLAPRPPAGVSTTTLSARCAIRIAPVMPPLYCALVRT